MISIQFNSVQLSVLGAVSEEPLQGSWVFAERIRPLTGTHSPVLTSRRQEIKPCLFKPPAALDSHTRGGRWLMPRKPQHKPQHTNTRHDAVVTLTMRLLAEQRQPTALMPRPIAGTPLLPHKSPVAHNEQLPPDKGLIRRKIFANLAKTEECRHPQTGLVL